MGGDNSSSRPAKTKHGDGNANSGAELLDAGEYNACLLSLVLGRSSVLFAWSDEQQTFQSVLANARISGFSAAVLRSVERACVACGNDSRRLRAFVDTTFASAGGSPASLPPPSCVALARGVGGLLLTIQGELGVRGQQARSLLQLQALVQPVASLLAFVRGLVDKLARAADASNNEACDYEAFLTSLFEEAQSMEYSAVFVRDIIKHLLQLASAPWLGFVRAWIGLDPQSKATLWMGQLHSRGFVRIGDREWVDDMGIEHAETDYFLDHVPGFVPEEMAKDLFETGRNLRFLWTNHPEHPLSDTRMFALASPPALRWQFDWESIRGLGSQAQAYQQKMSQLLAAKQRGPSLSAPAESVTAEPHPDSAGDAAAFVWRLPSVNLAVFGQSETQIEQSVEASNATLCASLPPAAEGELAAVLRRQLFSDDAGRSDSTTSASALDEFTPHWSLLPLLSFGPVISAQARLVSRECMRMLFSAHGVRQHLQLQRDYQLLGNGVFCSRLSHALFDPDLAGADQTTGVQLSSGALGLRLASHRGRGRGRENWPPASSELRLALLGVLAESSAVGRTSTWRVGLPPVPDLANILSFAIRDLTPAEMERCMDPEGLEALDFLRLSYKPPAALLPVFSPAILAKYDAVFRLLLRVLRMYYVVNQLAGEALHAAAARSRPSALGCRGKAAVAARFRIEARHFVASVMAYFMETGVSGPWQRFDAWLDGVEESLGSSSSSSDGHGRATPDMLRARHEQALDEMMLALLQRRRQRPLLLLLEAIFGLILEFAGQSDHAQTPPKPPSRLYASFRKKVAAFLAVCRGLSEKEADSAARRDYRQQQALQDGTRAGEGGALARLVLMLDYSGTYTASASLKG